MSWEQYEVWAEDEEGREELVETTKSLKEAKSLAQKTLNSGFISAKIMRESDEDYEEISRLRR